VTAVVVDVVAGAGRAQWLGCNTSNTSIGTSINCGDGGGRL